MFLCVCVNQNAFFVEKSLSIDHGDYSVTPLVIAGIHCALCSAEFDPRSGPKCKSHQLQRHCPIVRRGINAATARKSLSKFLSRIRQLLASFSAVHLPLCVQCRRTGTVCRLVHVWVQTPVPSLSTLCIGTPWNQGRHRDPTVAVFLDPLYQRSVFLFAP
jgi:hypothetical protein